MEVAVTVRDGDQCPRHVGRMVCYIMTCQLMLDL